MENKFITKNFSITCSDEEIKENDLFYIIDGHPVGDGIRTCYWISKDRPCWSDENQNWTSKICDMLYIDKYEENGWGFVERHKCKKIISYKKIK